MKPICLANLILCKLFWWSSKNIKVSSNEDLNLSGKRGREFGYKHSSETKSKIKASLEHVKENLKLKASFNKEKVSKNITEYYDNKKIEKLTQYNLDKDIESYIKPVYKNSDIVSYKIYR